MTLTWGGSKNIKLKIGCLTLLQVIYPETAFRSNEVKMVALVYRTLMFEL